MVIIEMDNGGIIKLALDASAAPNTVKNSFPLRTRDITTGLRSTASSPAS